MRIIILFLITPFVSAIGQNAWMEEHDFVFLDDYLSYALYDVRYNGTNNFIGDTIDGYSTDKLVMTKSSAKALKKIESDLQASGYCLKIFDTYRPQQAVDHFKEWVKDISDTINKNQFYPHQDKRNLFELGYISSRSGHSRGSTIDLTLAVIETQEELDMGSPYDFFASISHHDADNISPQQAANRMILKKAMEKFGFRAYSKEWWHYTLNNEPYPNRYFNFLVSPR